MVPETITFKPVIPPFLSSPIVGEINWAAQPILKVSAPIVAETVTDVNVL